MFNLGLRRVVLFFFSKIKIEHCCPQIKKLNSFNDIFITELLSYTIAPSTQAVLVLEEALA